MLDKLLNRIPFRIIWFLDDHLNHYTWQGHVHCVNRWFCDYTDYRAVKDEI